MNPHIQALVDSTRLHVEAEHVVRFLPDDPGTADTLRAWRSLLQSGEVPSRASFELSEVIGSLHGKLPKDPMEASGKRCFRRFTSAVALGLIHNGNDPSIVCSVNYLAHDLVADCEASEPEHYQLVRATLLPTRDLLATTSHDQEFPFFTFAAMILAQMASDFDRWGCFSRKKRWKSTCCEAAAVESLGLDRTFALFDCFSLWSQVDCC